MGSRIDIQIITGALALDIYGGESGFDSTTEGFFASTLPHLVLADACFGEQS